MLPLLTLILLPVMARSQSTPEVQMADIIYYDSYMDGVGMVCTGGSIVFVCYIHSPCAGGSDTIALIDPDGNEIKTGPCTVQYSVWTIDVGENFKLGQYKCRYKGIEHTAEKANIACVSRA